MFSRDKETSSDLSLWVSLDSITVDTQANITEFNWIERLIFANFILNGTQDLKDDDNQSISHSR